MLCTARSRFPQAGLTASVPGRKKENSSVNNSSCSEFRCSCLLPLFCLSVRLCLGVMKHQLTYLLVSVVFLSLCLSVRLYLGVMKHQLTYSTYLLVSVVFLSLCLSVRLCLSCFCHSACRSVCVFLRLCPSVFVRTFLSVCQCVVYVILRFVCEHSGIVSLSV